jgi:hypothetical protein
VRFHHNAYDVTRTTDLLDKAPLARSVIIQLSTILKSGGAMGY